MSTATTQVKKRVGEILVEHGLLTDAQLKQALGEQKKAGYNRLLGEVVIELGFCTEEQVVEAVAVAYGMPYAKLSPQLVDRRVIGELPREFIEKQSLRAGDRVTVKGWKVEEYRGRRQILLGKWGSMLPHGQERLE